MTEPYAETPNLRSRVIRGLGWTTGAAVALQASRLAFGIVLARLLTPHEYGLAGMALVFSALVLVISDGGLGAGLVQRPTITEHDRSTVFWASLMIGLLLSVAGLALAAPVASFYGEPAVKPLFAVVSVGFVITGLGRAHAALFQREMAFRAIAVRVLVATVAGGAVGITMAVQGYGAWALIGLHLTNGAVTTLLLWTFSPWRPRFVFSVGSLRELGGFGLNVLGSKFMEYLHVNADKILIGRGLGSSALGVYNIAYNLVVLPFGALVIAAVDTLFPAMSRVQDDRDRLGRAWLRATRSFFVLAAPAMLGLAVTAPDVVDLLLGARWRGAVPVLQLISLALIVHSIAAFGTTVLIAGDRTGTVLRFSISEVAVVIAAVAVGLSWGIEGVAVGYLAATLLTRSVLVWLTARALGLGVASVARALSGVAQAALAMAVVAWLVQGVLADANVPLGARLAGVIAVGIAAYVPMCLWRAPEIAADIQAVREARSGA